VDFLGVLVKSHESQPAQTRNGVKNKRLIQCADDSGFVADFVVWSYHCDYFDNAQPGTIVLLKGCRVADYQGNKQLTTTEGSKIEVPPSEADHANRQQQLREWWASKPELKTVPASSGRQQEGSG
jgi:ssDNA-binding replication factor A large subunit